MYIYIYALVITENYTVYIYKSVYFLVITSVYRVRYIYIYIYLYIYIYTHIYTHWLLLRGGRDVAQVIKYSAVKV